MAVTFEEGCQALADVGRAAGWGFPRMASFQWAQYRACRKRLALELGATESEIDARMRVLLRHPQPTVTQLLCRDRAHSAPACATI